MNMVIRVACCAAVLQFVVAESLAIADPANAASKPRSAAKGVQSQPATNQRTTESAVAERPDACRYRYDGHLWWYYAANNRWIYWNGTSWQPIPSVPSRVVNDGIGTETATAVDDLLPGGSIRSQLVPQRTVDPYTGSVTETYRYQKGTNRIGQNN